MPRPTQRVEYDVDLQGGVVPISRAASSLAALLKRSRERQQPIIVTQKGYPTGVLLPVELYADLRERAELALRRGKVAAAPPEAEALLGGELAAADEAEVTDEQSGKGASGGRRSRKKD